MLDSASRSPHGERGLKYVRDLHGLLIGQSLSSWRAWIEIITPENVSRGDLSLSSWRAWIEICRARRFCRPTSSLSSWRAWIEISAGSETVLLVASLSSWRAWIEIATPSGRQTQNLSRSPHGERGLKLVRPCGAVERDGSLSSWRAWIEMMPIGASSPSNMSLSSWRAWIEITSSPAKDASPTSRSPHGERGLK